MKKGHPFFSFSFFFKGHLHNDPHVSRHDFEVVSQLRVVDGDCFASIGDASNSLHDKVLAVLEDDVASNILLDIEGSESDGLHYWLGCLSMDDRSISIFYLRLTCNTLASSSIFLDTAFTSTSKIDGCCER